MQTVLGLKYELLAVDAHLVRSLGVDAVGIKLFHMAALVVGCCFEAQRFLTSCCHSCWRVCAAFSQMMVCSVVLVAISLLYSLFTEAKIQQFLESKVSSVKKYVLSPYFGIY